MSSSFSLSSSSPIASQEKLASLAKSITQIAADLISSNLISDFTTCPFLINPQITSNRQFPFGSINATVIEEPTSDQETTNDLEVFEILNKPTFREICDFFLDSEMIRTITSEDLFPPEAIRAVFLPNISQTNATGLSLWLREQGIDLDSICEFRIISFYEESFSLIKFDSIDNCIKAFKKLLLVEPKVSYCYDGTDLPNSNWFPVVIRDIPLNLSIDQIKSIYLKDFEEDITKAIGPTLVGGINSCLIVTKSLEAAEKICYFTMLTNPDIKAHLHYKICKTRTNKDKSHFANYFELRSRNQSLLTLKLFNKKKKEINIIDVLNNEEKKMKKERAEKSKMEKKEDVTKEKLLKLIEDMKGNKGKKTIN